MNVKKYFKVGLLFITLFVPSFLYSQNFGYYATAVWFEQVGVSNQFLNINSKDYIYTAQQNAVNLGNGDWTSIKFQNFGSFVANSGTLLFRGAEVRTFKKSNGNICTPELDYMIYPTGYPPYSTTTLTLGSVQSCDLTTQTYPDGLGPCSLSGFQKWQTLSLSPNAPILDLTKYPEGSYTIELYFKIPGSSIDPNGCNEFVLDDNGGSNYKATFQICPSMSFLSKTDPVACGGNGTITMSINGVPDSVYNDRFYYEDATNTTHFFTNVKVQSNVATVYVPSGTYTNIRYNHSNNCGPTTGFNVILNEPSVPTTPVIGTITQPTCALPTGSVQLSSLPSGTWTITPSVGNPVTGSGNSFVFSGLTPSTNYTFTVSDALSCTSAPTSTVSMNALQTPAIPTTTSITQPTCAIQTGTITIATQPGVEYSINGTTWQSSNIFSGLPPGTYYYSVRNLVDNTCSITSSNPVVIAAIPTPPAVPTASGIIQPTCGVQTGSLTITPQTDVEYSLNDTKWQSSNTISGILPGTYSFYVRHISDTTCINQSASTITINPIPNAPVEPTALSIIQPTCGTPTGSITITTQNGVEYSIDGTHWQASNVFSGLAQGSSLTLYVRKIADSTCVNFSTTPVQLMVSSVPATPTAVIVQPTCAIQTGSITIASQTGVEYSIDGTNWQPGNTFSNLMSGSSYTLYVRKTSDASCINTSVSSFTIHSIPTPPALPTATLIQPTCAIQSGTITIAAQTGVEYSINGSNWQTSNLFSSLAPGSYPLFVRNINDNTCISQSASNVLITAIPTPPAVPTISSVVQPTCAFPNGTITISAQTGIEYSIDGTNWQSGNVFSGLLPGSYTVYAREKANPTCFQTIDVLIYEVLCANDDVFQPVSSQTGGVVGNIFSNDYFNQNPLDPSTVNLTLSLPSGMSIDNNGNISVNAQMPEGTYTFMYSICEKQHPDNCDTATVKVQVTDFTKFISFTKTATVPQLSKDGTYSMVYTLTGKNKSASSIQDIQMVDDLTKTFPSPISFTVESIMGGDKLKANTQYDGKTEQNTLTGTGKLDASESDSIKIFVKLNPNGFEGTISNQAAFNAFSSAKGPINNLLSDDPTRVGVNLRPTISLLQKIELFIPDAFSPNGDGFNDKFVIIHSSVYSINLKVFNRWGNIVYQNNNYQNDWDGKGSGLFSNQELPNGTYYYVIELVDSQGGKNQLFKGYLTLRR